VFQLAQIFAFENYLRLYLNYHVSIVVSKQRLNNALRIDESFIKTLQSIKKSSLLSLHESVSYLHEAHRLEASNIFLHSNDK